MSALASYRRVTVLIFIKSYTRRVSSELAGVQQLTSSLKTLNAEPR